MSSLKSVSPSLLYSSQGLSMTSSDSQSPARSLSSSPMPAQSPLMNKSEISLSPAILLPARDKDIYPVEYDVDPKKENEGRGVVTILGVPLPLFPGHPEIRICFLVAMVIGSYIIISILKESIFKKAKCTDGGFVSLVQFTVFWILALLERRHNTCSESKKNARKVPLKTHILLGVFAALGLAMGTYAMQLLNFPTWLVFKSARVIATMVGGIVLNKHRYGIAEYFGVFCVFIGLIVFSIGDFRVSPELNNIGGLTLVILALLCNAVQDNTQEKALHKYHCSENELMAYTYGIGALCLLPWTVVTQELWGGAKFCFEHPFVFVQILAASVLAYVGTSFILSLMRETGALTVAITTSCRRALSILVSFILFDKPFVMSYAYGVVIVLTGVIVNVFGRRARAKAEKKAKLLEGKDSSFSLHKSKFSLFDSCFSKEITL